MLNRLICLILGYFIGAIIQTGFWIGKFNHIDIRDYGSGNAGTTNTMRTLGKNMAFLMKSIQMGKEKWDFPKKNRQFLQIFIIIVKNEEDCLWNIQH